MTDDAPAQAVEQMISNLERQRQSWLALLLVDPANPGAVAGCADCCRVLDWLATVDVEELIEGEGRS